MWDVSSGCYLPGEKSTTVQGGSNPLQNILYVVQMYSPYAAFELKDFCMIAGKALRNVQKRVEALCRLKP